MTFIRSLAFAAGLLSMAWVSVAYGAIEQFTDGVHRIEDTDYESKADFVYDSEGNLVSSGFNSPYLLDGDALYGVFSIQHLYRDAVPPPEAAFIDLTSTLTGVFAGKVVVGSVDVAGDTAKYSFEPLTDAEFAAVFPGVTRVDSSSMLLIYDTAKPVGTFPDLASSIATGIANASAGTKVAEFGILGAGDTWTARVVDDVAVPDPTNILAIDPGSSTFRASLSLTYDNPSDALQFLTITDAPFPIGSGVTGLASNEIHLAGQIVSAETTEWALVTHTDAWVNAQVVPEPQSLVAWAGLGIIGLVSVRGRSKSSRVC